MMYSSIVLAALAHSSAVLAATMQVSVGTNNQFVFTPDTMVAQPGDMIAFNFVSQNHSVASSNANSPCTPEKNAIFSDFQPVAAPAGANANAAAAAGGNGKAKGKKTKGKNNKRQAANTPMFMVPVTDNQPMYIYCSQAQHCQQGMVMVVNPPAAGMGVAQYRQLAAQANQNKSPKGGISGGQIVNNAAGTNPPNGVLGAAAATAQTNGGNGKGKGKGKAAAAKGKGKGN
ncbi:uncharacterized protein N0V89_012410 [Didymosphaeria variabile]|uniref:Cupredoxin n=1 Tax=Didymosphaeria variabile TaxID=1932322 RepID=A0A9W8X9C4_9PLEO|nr:uncharacterized protein N0V89_012410 [Didymosphaeria variabile]KAJ4344666.1 hypothetical protein N0V89_012410 [Didymosphaeria variabile]